MKNKYINIEIKLIANAKQKCENFLKLIEKTKVVEFKPPVKLMYEVKK